MRFHAGTSWDDMPDEYTKKPPKTRNRGGRSKPNLMEYLLKCRGKLESLAHRHKAMKGLRGV
jgi:hypothetical protein